MQSVKKAVNEDALLPDYRLAQVFNFTAADLSANRNGFLSWGQQYRLGRRGQRWLAARLALYKMLQVFVNASTINTPASVCGRINVQHRVMSATDPKSGRLLLYHRYILLLENVQFNLTNAQYQALGTNIPYRIYYAPASDEDNEPRILTLERVESGCHHDGRK